MFMPTLAKEMNHGSATFGISWHFGIDRIVVHEML
jgi:hypothetical protein